VPGGKAGSLPKEQLSSAYKESSPSLDQRMGAG
jgi:hypothetical protein